MRKVLLVTLGVLVFMIIAVVMVWKQKTNAPFDQLAGEVVASIPRVTSTPITPSMNNAQKDTLESLIYPHNSQIIGKTSSEVFVKSQDSPEKITAWYKDQMKKQGLNIETAVVTNANGEVQNILVSTNNQKEVTVKVNKSQDISYVMIDVALKQV